MSRADSKSVERGTTITTDDLNEKFSDLETITSGNIDETNLRNEAIDQPNLEFRYGTGGDQGYVLKAYGSMDNGNGTGVYVAGAGATHLSHGTEAEVDLSSSPLEVKHSDVLRLYWDIAVKSQSLTGAGSIGATQTGVFWVVWPEWYVDGAWATIPNTPSFNSSTEAVSSSSHSHGVMLVPHTWRVYNAALPASPLNLTLDATSFRQGWYYRSASASTTTVSKFRLMIDGVYGSHQDGSGDSTLEPEDEWDGDHIEITQVNMNVLHMDGG